jgi:hypothetical protein
MPMQTDLYPEDWKQIAEAAKEAANWTCEKCGAQRGELRANRHGVEKATVITVAHLDHDPWRSKPRLAVLCAPCHLRYDASQRCRQRRMMRIARGQQVLPGMRAWYHPPRPVKEEKKMGP